MTKEVTYAVNIRQALLRKKMVNVTISKDGKKSV